MSPTPENIPRRIRQPASLPDDCPPHRRKVVRLEILLARFHECHEVTAHSAKPPINKRGSIEVDPSAFVKMEAILPDTDVAAELRSEATVSGTTGSCWIGFK